MRNMRYTILNLFALLAVATALFTFAGVPQARAAADLTGVWHDSGDGTWYIQQVGTVVWFYGENSNTNPGWATVFRGVISGHHIKGSYSTVPKGQIYQIGTDDITIVSDNELKNSRGVVFYRY